MFEIIGFIAPVIIGLLFTICGLTNMKHNACVLKRVNNVSFVIFGLLILYGCFVNMPFDMGGW